MASFLEWVHMVATDMVKEFFSISNYIIHKNRKKKSSSCLCPKDSSTHSLSCLRFMSTTVGHNVVRGDLDHLWDKPSGFAEVITVSEGTLEWLIREMININFSLKMVVNYIFLY